MKPMQVNAVALAGLPETGVDASGVTASLFRLSAGLGCKGNDMNEQHRLDCIAEAMEGQPLQVGDERKPRFGEWMRGIYASKQSPIRDGMYVETRRRTGRCNPGCWYRLTDGKGAFWEFEARSTVFLQPKT